MRADRSPQFDQIRAQNWHAGARIFPKLVRRTIEMIEARVFVGNAPETGARRPHLEFGVRNAGQKNDARYGSPSIDV